MSFSFLIVQIICCQFQRLDFHDSLVRVLNTPNLRERNHYCFCSSRVKLVVHRYLVDRKFSQQNTDQFDRLQEKRSSWQSLGSFVRWDRECMYAWFGEKKLLNKQQSRRRDLAAISRFCSTDHHLCCSAVRASFLPAYLVFRIQNDGHEGRSCFFLWVQIYVWNEADFWVQIYLS